MFLGHFGVAFAAKRVAPKTSLGMLLLGAQFADLLWPLLLLAGVESVQIRHGETPFLNLAFSSYPYSHSLLTQCALGVLLGGAYFAFARNARGAIVVGLLVPSHWLLDWFVHVPDLQLAPGGADRFGFAVWRSVPLTLICEFAMFGGGLAVYLATTRAIDRTGVWALTAFVVLLISLYIASILGPPPPSVGVLAASALAIWLLPPWLYWVDRHRSLRRAA